MNKDELELRIAVLNEETDATYINILDKAVEKREEWEIYSFKRIKKLFHLDLTEWRSVAVITTISFLH